MTDPTEVQNSNLLEENVIGVNTQDPIDPPTEDDPIIVEPIYSADKISGYINRMGIWNGDKDGKVYLNNFNRFARDFKLSQAYAGAKISSEEEIRNTYDSFRDADAEEAERTRLQSLYITQRLNTEQVVQSGVNSSDIVDDADALYFKQGDDVKTKYKRGRKKTNEEILQTYNDMYTGDKFDRLITSKYLESTDYRIQEIDYNYLEFDSEKVKLYNENDVYQNIYRGSRHEAFKSLSSYNYDFDIDGTFGQMIESLDFNFILKLAPEAAEIFNQKFSSYGYTAKPVVTRDVPGISKPEHSIQIFDQSGNMIQQQRLFGSQIMGLDKEQLLDLLAVKDEEDPGGLLQTIIRPQVYTQEYGNFITEFKANVQNNSPAANFAVGWSSSDDKLRYSVKEMDFMNDIGVESSNVIVNIANEVGIDMVFDDVYKNYRTGDSKMLFDSPRVSGFITMAREKIRSTPEGQGVQIDLRNEDIRLDKDGILGAFQYQYDLGVNGSQHLLDILGRSANINDTIVDRYGNTETVRNILLKSLDRYSNMIRRNQDNVSRQVGLGLRVDANFRDIPLEGLESNLMLAGLQDRGMNIFNHMPTDGITIDGIPSTYEQVFNIVTDPSLNNKVRLKEIDIQIGNPDDFGYMADPIKAAKALMERNNSKFNGILGYRNEFTNFLDQSYEWGEDLFQSIGIEFLNMGASMKELTKDTMIGFGMSEDVADFITNPYMVSMGPGMGSPLTVYQPGKFFSKDYVNDLRAEFLPLWRTSIADASGDDALATIGEFFMLANQPLGQSLPYMGAIMVNPYFGVATIGMTSYGDMVYNYGEQRDRLQKAYDAGVPLTDVEMNMMEMTDGDLRLLAGSGATIEAGMTAIFTTRYLHGSKVWSKLWGKKAPPTGPQIDKLAKEMAFRFDKGYNASFNRLMGIEGRALAIENLEEFNISLWKYQIEAWAGIREFNHTELGKLLKETAYHSSFSSIGLSTFMRYGGNNNLNSITEIVMQENLGTSNLYKQTDLKINVSQALQKYVKDQTNQGQSQKQIENSQFYKWASDYLIKTEANIKEITDSRKRLVKELDTESRLRFITVLAEIENLNTTLVNTAENSTTRISALSDLKILKAELADIVGMTANPDAFQFIPFDKQANYYASAFAEINYEELKEKEPNITRVEWEKRVNERAKELYVIDAKAKVKARQEDENVSPFITPQDGEGDIASIYGRVNVNEIISEDIDEDFLRQFNLNDQLNLSDTNILNSYGPTITVAKDADGNVIGEKREDGTIIERDADGKVTKVTPYNQTLEAAENSFPLDDTPATDAQLEASAERERVNKLRGKVTSIIDRIKGYKAAQNNEFIQSFDNNPLNTDKSIKNDATASYIIKFFETLNGASNFTDLKVEDFQFQRIESILDAYDIVTQIRMTEGDQSQDPFKGNPLLRKTLEVYAGKYLFGAKNSIATLDILKNLVIRNRNAAVPFINLYEEINRKVDVATKTSNMQFTSLKDLYLNEKTKFEGKGFFRRALDKRNTEVTLQDDIEMSLLAGLRRVNLDSEDVNLEFNRYKKNVLEELQIRKNEANESNHPLYTKSERKKRYEDLLAAVNKLGLQDAQSYADVKGKANPYNVKVIEEITRYFKQGEDAAKDRVYGFGQQWTNFDNYLPIFLTKNPTFKGSQLTDKQYLELDTSVGTTSINTSGALQYASTPDSYYQNNKGQFRLKFGGFLNQAALSLQGSKIDAEVRKDMQTMVELFNNPQFEKLFKNPQDYRIMKDLFAVELNRRFNVKVNEGKSFFTDFGDMKQLKFTLDPETFKGQNIVGIKDYIKKTVNMFYGLGSAKALSTFTQPTQQFYSALTNHWARVESREASSYLQSKGGQFLFGVAGTANGSKRTTMVGQLVQEMIGNGDLSNIYALSQTSMRNALKAELPLSDNRALDLSYYEKTFNLPDNFFSQYIQSGKYTFDSLMDKVNASTELSLNFFLARTDRIAANAAFEAHYLDFKIKNGAKYPKGKDARKKWWAQENQNPDKAAINYADGVVKEVMRPSGSLSEAGAYTGNNTGKQAFLQTFYPFAKFQLNAKTQFWTQYALSIDENLPADQRRDAQRAMQGIMGEMAVFQGTKTGMQSVIYGTMASTLLGFDEEEIERYGGIQAIISEFIVPIDDREFMQKLQKLYNDYDGESPVVDSIEFLNGFYEMSMNHRVGEDFTQNFRDLQNYANTYQNKTDLSPKNNNVMQMVIGDLIKTINPVPVPDAAMNFVFANINYYAQKSGLVGDKIFLEFMSEDFDKGREPASNIFLGPLPSAFGGNLTWEILGENLGLYGITAQDYQKCKEAWQLMENNSITKRTPTGAKQTQYVGSGNEIINRRIDQAITYVFITRLLTAVNAVPGGPTAEFSKINDRMFRSLERYVNETMSAAGDTPQSTPDPEMREGLLRWLTTLEEQKKQREDEPLDDGF